MRRERRPPGEAPSRRRRCGTPPSSSAPRTCSAGRPGHGGEGMGWGTGRPRWVSWGGTVQAGDAGQQWGTAAAVRRGGYGALADATKELGGGQRLPHGQPVCRHRADGPHAGGVCRPELPAAGDTGHDPTAVCVEPQRKWLAAGGGGDVPPVGSPVGHPLLFHSCHRSCSGGGTFVVEPSVWEGVFYGAVRGAYRAWPPAGRLGHGLGCRVPGRGRRHRAPAAAPAAHVDGGGGAGAARPHGPRPRRAPWLRAAGPQRGIGRNGGAGGRPFHLLSPHPRSCPLLHHADAGAVGRGNGPFVGGR